MNIGLVGFFGHNNIGDEAILHSMICQLKKYHKKINIVVFTDEPKKTFEKYKVIVFYRKKLTHIIAGINYCDLIIFAGGSLFQDQTSILNMFYYFGIAKITKLFKKKLILYAQGFDTLGSFFSRILLKESIFIADKVSARDYKSISYVKNKLKVKKKINFVMDSALLLQPYQKDNKYINYCGINLLNSSNLEKIANEILIFQKITGSKIVFVSCNPADLKNYFYLKEKVEIELIEEEDPVLLMGYIKQMQFFIGQRYHSLVFCASARTPFLYLGNKDKGVAFSDMLKQKVAVPTVKNLGEKMVSYFTDRKLLKNQLSVLMEQVEKDSTPELIGNILVRYC
jgi:polysaccharide pyruvyl transferase CsaB